MPEILVEVDEPDLRFIDQVATKEKRSRRAQVSKILEEYVIEHSKLSALIEREKK